MRAGTDSFVIGGGAYPDPRRAGYRMPAEWETHAATWLAWPHNSDTWSSHLEQVRLTWVELMAALVPVERVELLVNDAAAEAEVTDLLHARGVALGGVRFRRIPTVDVWIRDYGPTFLVSARAPDPLALINWTFNAWGEKYAEYVADDSVVARMNAFLGLPDFQPGVVLEGGSIEVNGVGTLLTTEQCLLNPNRNQKPTRELIEKLLGACLCVDHVIWLEGTVAGDDTDGHIDNLARFIDQRTVVCVLEEDPGDENYQGLRENHQRLMRATNAAGEALRVLTLPQPDPVFEDGARLPASYANFYIANETVLIPLFGGSKDMLATEILRGVSPTHRVVGVNAVALIHGLGGIHCVTQQQPLTRPRDNS